MEKRKSIELICNIKFFLLMNFTTRSSEGSDDLLRNIPYNSLISIHAPARGATTAFFALVKLGLFQSTLPRRERRSGITI